MSTNDIGTTGGCNIFCLFLSDLVRRDDDLLQSWKRQRKELMKAVSANVTGHNCYTAVLHTFTSLLQTTSRRTTSVGWKATPNGSTVAPVSALKALAQPPTHTARVSPRLNRASSFTTSDRIASPAHSNKDSTTAAQIIHLSRQVLRVSNRLTADSPEKSHDTSAQKDQAPASPALGTPFLFKIFWCVDESVGLHHGAITDSKAREFYRALRFAQTMVNADIFILSSGTGRPASSLLSASTSSSSENQKETVITRWANVLQTGTLQSLDNLVKVASTASTCCWRGTASRPGLNQPLQIEFHLVQQDLSTSLRPPLAVGTAVQANFQVRPLLGMAGSVMNHF